MHAQALEIDFDIPVALDYEYATLRDRVDAAIRSLAITGQTAKETSESAPHARQIFLGDAVNTPQHIPDDPAVILQLKALLNEYDHMVVHSAATLRNYITNRLLEESLNSTPGGKLKALELLGKISDVGLFTEKSEVTVRNANSSEVIEMLKTRIRNAIQPADDAEIKPETPTPTLSDESH